MTISLRCVPPSITAQQKRVSVVNGRPVFFHSRQMKEQASTWTSLLTPYQPVEPMQGAVSLLIRMTYPHLRATRQRDLHRIIPKVSRPDAGNAAKHLEDMLVRLRFLEDDQQVARLTVEKFHGPESEVGIVIEIQPMPVVEAQSEKVAALF